MTNSSLQTSMNVIVAHAHKNVRTHTVVLCVDVLRAIYWERTCRRAPVSVKLIIKLLVNQS